ncbi:hypothetical protein BKA67DRAFT_561017 [Truncatella angustata]|uniref:rRNA methyltransferase 1, mitochondrial n=1 Tax=Truncatella angustata TaxID=152316 RepID=A0A9P8UNW6_9PEZI|nr:uncharacterized protein BKA67DRAFT_561017 [Truncatella angustata]KAH6655542.1 hypothetical protein BKA67DRAFT_561017 [Truncatella angustata]
MRQFTSLCSLAKHNVPFKTSTLHGLNHVPVRYSSLSAIHRGLRDSEKSRPQGFARGALDTSASLRTKRTTSRSRRDPDWTPPGFVIKRGKNDITDEGPKPKSKRERFNDPTETFGKKSHVYLAKTGRLREELDALKGDLDPTDRGTFESKFTGKFNDDFGQGRSSRGKDERRPSGFARSGGRDNARFASKGHGSRSDHRAAPSRDDGGRGRSGDRPARRFDDRDSRRPSDRPARRFEDRDGGMSGDRNNGRSQYRPAPRSEDRTSRFDNSSTEDGQSFRPTVPSHDLPIRIRHTTAASQFLYGRSVVEAAMKASRRKIYHLYLYAGRDRQNLVQDASLENLARKQGVEVTKIYDNDGLRMMDKMSVGRPHNGCVLETSPTPQIPLKSLGQLSEDPSKPGINIELAYQSAEDAAINGTPDMIPYHSKNNRNPFFLLLDGILDPGNLGAILRSAAFLGVTGVVISKGGSAGLTPVSLKASSGASEVLPLYSVSSTPDFLERSKENGWMIYASVAAGPRSRGNSHLTLDRVEAYDPLSENPTILVIGSEGEGLEKKIKRLADFEVSIPGQSGLLSTIDSLNVSVATGIMCSAFLKKNQGFEIEESTESIKEQNSDESPLW